PARIPRSRSRPRWRSCGYLGRSCAKSFSLVRKQPPRRGPPVDAAGRSVVALPPGHPEPLRPWGPRLTARYRKCLHHCSSVGLLVRVELADQQQRQAPVADRGEQAAQGRLVGDRPDKDGLAAVVAGDSQAVEPGRPAAVQDALDADLVMHWRLRPSSPLGRLSWPAAQHRPWDGGTGGAQRAGGVAGRLAGADRWGLRARAYFGGFSPVVVRQQVLIAGQQGCSPFPIHGRAAKASVVGSGPGTDGPARQGGVLAFSAWLGDPLGGERHAQLVQLHPDPRLAVTSPRRYEQALRGASLQGAHRRWSLWAVRGGWVVHLGAIQGGRRSPSGTTRSHGSRGGRRPLPEQPQLAGAGDGLGAVGRAELAEDVGGVLFGRISHHPQ